jgi:hypothetical protein
VSPPLPRSPVGDAQCELRTATFLVSGGAPWRIVTVTVALLIVPSALFDDQLRLAAFRK